MWVFRIPNRRWKRGKTTTNGPTTNTFGIGALPGISYDISDKIELEGFLNFFNLNLSQSVKTTTTGTSEIKAKTNNFGFSTNLDNVMNTGSFTVGAIYKFRGLPVGGHAVSGHFLLIGVCKKRAKDFPLPSVWREGEILAILLMASAMEKGFQFSRAQLWQYPIL